MVLLFDVFISAIFISRFLDFTLKTINKNKYFEVNLILCINNERFNIFSSYRYMKFYNDWSKNVIS